MKTEIQVTVKVSNYGAMSFAQLRSAMHEKLDQAEEVFADVVMMAATIRDRTLWRPQYRSFDDFLRAFVEERRQRKVASGEHWNYGYKLANQIKVCLDLCTTVQNQPPCLPNERQARELGALKEPETRRLAYDGATAAAAKEGLDQPQQRHVEAAVDRLKESAAIEDPAERRRAQEQAIDDMIAEQEEQPAHKTQRPREDKHQGHLDQAKRWRRTEQDPEKLQAMALAAVESLLTPDLDRLARLSAAERKRLRAALEQAAGVLRAEKAVLA